MASRHPIRPLCPSDWFRPKEHIPPLRADAQIITDAVTRTTLSGGILDE